MTCSPDSSKGSTDPLSLEGLPELTERDESALRRMARRSIENGIREGRALIPDPGDVSSSLQTAVATFVTLNKAGELRGCVGSYVPRRSLAEDVAHNAFAAAFRDPRFPPLREEEFDELQLHISLLTPLAPLDVDGPGELRQTLRPGIDGLFLEDPPRRATFLPQVWEALPDPEDFIHHLFLKAGLEPDHWSPTLAFKRYRVREI